MLSSHFWKLIYLFLLGLFLSGCAFQQSSSTTTGSASWSYSDLRVIDPVDSINSNQDLIAAYLQQDGKRTEIRLDFFELSEIPDFDLYLALDTSPGGRTDLPESGSTHLAWDSLLVIPAKDALKVIQNTKSETERADSPARISGLHILREPRQDMIVISFDRIFADPTSPELNIGIEAFLINPGSEDIVDQLGPFQSASSPPSPAPVLLAFWNTLPAYTPIQDLRRWDGAHTGPLGGRHGLYNLLRTASSAGVPIFLLDLAQPASLSALDATGGIDLVKDMEKGGLLSLPEVLAGITGSNGLYQFPSQALIEFLDMDQATRRDFGFSSDPSIYLPAGVESLADLVIKPARTQNRVLFLPLPEIDPNSETMTRLEPIWPLSWKGDVIIPLMVFGETRPDVQQLDRQGLSQAARNALVLTALQTWQQTSTEFPILVLGGDLTSTAWGDPQAARAAFHYIQNHPWISLLYPKQVDALRQSSRTFDPLKPTELHPHLTETADLVDHLQSAPANRLGDAAWQAYRAMYTTVSPFDPRLAELRAAYAGQIDILIKAAHWAQKPEPGADCNNDLDQDGQAECWIASDRVLAIFEMDYGGYLAYLFGLDSNGSVHQIIAPSSTLISGTSPSATWDFSKGILTDPQVIPGAFWNSEVPTSLRARWEIEPDGLKLSDDFSGRAVDYRLQTNGLRAEFSMGTEPANTLSETFLPLNLDPWLRFEPGWTERYHSSSQNGIWTWEIINGPQVEVSTDAGLTAQAWSDHLKLLGFPEDPNREVPDGFRLPFPIAAARIDAQQEFWIEISLK